MKTAIILRQMPVALSVRPLGRMPPQRALPATPAAAPVMASAAAPAAADAIEAEIEQRGLALAQRLMQTEAQALRERAREDGLRAGREEGLQAGLRQARTQIADQMAAQQVQFQQVADALREALARERQATEDAALELAMAALTRILGEAPDAARVTALLRQAATQLRDPGQIRIRLAPADLALLEEAGIDLAAPAAQVQWVADPGVRGGCVLQTATGNLDARLQQQVSALADALLQVYRADGARE